VSARGNRIFRFNGRKARRRSENTIVLGTGARARQLASAIESDPSRRIRILGFLDDDPPKADRIAVGARYLGPVSRLAEIASEHTVSQVIFALPRRYLGSESIANATAVCEMLGIDLTIPVDLFETRVARLATANLSGSPAITLSTRHHHSEWKLAIKRGIDITGALLIMLITLPLWILVAVGIKLDTPGPVLFIQPRCGCRGHTFPFLKFRTMFVDAEERLAEVMKLNEQTGPVFKIQDDPRITRVGRILRKFSIDELPQLLNVLVGQMSLVGPRPPLPSEVQHYETDHRGRLSMRPGITCLWQVSGRNQIAFEDWVKLDLEYVERWSLLLDFEILLATVPAVLTARGAS
jgi:exopolysaccharide biosynthesis polyprenyl glycosylphosphotransferase